MMTVLTGLGEAPPLDRFAVIRSRDPEEVRGALLSTFGARRFTPVSRGAEFDVRANRWQSRDVGLSYCNCGDRAEVEFPAASFFRQQFSLQGIAQSFLDRSAREVSPQTTCVIPLESELTIRFTPGFEQIVLRIDAQAARSKLAAMLGAPLSRDLVFDDAVSLDTPQGASLKRAVGYFVSEVSGGELGKSPLALAELEQGLIAAFIICNSHNYTDRMYEPVSGLGGGQLRQMEEYILAHWNEPLTIENIASSISVSARSIFHNFKRRRGQSPMQFVKQVRLKHARHMLVRGDAPISVTEVAFACGFGNLGHFARDYFRAFGERPSETVRKHRRQHN
jgi:AraC-like DNA-binding protein